MKTRSIMWITGIVITIIFMLTFSGMTQIGPGNRGVKVTWGEVQPGSLPEGFYFYTPFKDKIVEFDAKERVFSNRLNAFSYDIQSVEISYAITYYPQRDKLDVLYRDYGIEYADKILKPIIYNSIKEIGGQYTATEMITKRADLTRKINDKIIEEAGKRFIVVTKVDIVDMNFTKEFKDAIEAKVIAVQQAEQAKNVTVRIEEEAKQRIIQAEAEAKSIQIRSEALSKNKSLVEWEAVKKWDGKLPQFVGGQNTTPFINLKTN